MASLLKVMVFQLVCSHKNQNWMKEAEESLRRATELDDGNVEYFSELADLYSRQGMTERAAAIAAKIEELDPKPQPKPEPEPDPEPEQELQSAVPVADRANTSDEAQDEEPTEVPDHVTDYDDDELEVNLDFETEAETPT